MFYVLQGMFTSSSSLDSHSPDRYIKIFLGLPMIFSVAEDPSPLTPEKYSLYFISKLALGSGLSKIPSSLFPVS